MTATEQKQTKGREELSAARLEATRRAVLDAAVGCILERGFYRASSNEIARRAGVTWGVIQHHFGTRERLMVAVLEDGSRRFWEAITQHEIDADTAEERVHQLITMLATHYGSPEYLVDMQIALNLDHDPETSADVRGAMVAVARKATEQLRSLLRATLGPAGATPDLASTVFLTIRGFLLSQQLHATMTYDSVVPETDRVARQQRLLAQLLAPMIEKAAEAAD